MCGCTTTPSDHSVGGGDMGVAARMEIATAFSEWDAATGRGDLASVMEKFDQSDTIMIVGSDKGEVFKGRQQIEGWLKKLFVNNRFTWGVKQMEIDQYEANSAWIFIDGTMRISDLNGKVKGETPYRITGAMVRRGSQWKWRIWSGAIPAGE